MTAYEWMEGRRIRSGLDADVVASEIEKIVARDGVCSPAAYVEEARPPLHPLHPTLEWDDEKAADRWRRHEARYVISSLRIVSPDKASEHAPAFVHVRSKLGDEGYVTQEQLRTNTSYREFALNEARQALAALRRRYASLEELAEIWAAIDAAESGSSGG